MASASGGRVRVVSSSASANNGGRTELAHTQRMERMDESKVIRIPRRIKLNEDHHPEFTAHQVLMMRQFLNDNNANLSQLLTTLATDENQSMDVFLARAYNAAISDQQRKIMSKRRNDPFAFCDIEGKCGPTCKFRVQVRDDPGLGIVTGCVSHDLVKTLLDEDPNFGYPRLLGESRALLNYAPIRVWKTHQEWMDRAQYVKECVHDRMDEVVGMLDEWIACIPSHQPRTHYDEKFLALDVQYKIIHCLLSGTQTNPIKKAIKAKTEMWEGLEDCFMEVFERFDKDDLHRLKTEDDGIWYAMFDLVCQLADRNDILPKLSKARQTIAESSLPNEETCEMDHKAETDFMRVPVNVVKEEED